MKYMLLIYLAENAMTDEERAQCYVKSSQLAHDLHAEGKFLATAPLQPVTSAKSLRVRAGKAFVTDGPFAETREHLGGFYLIEARDLDEALSVAERIPGARVGTVEIRPVLALEGLPPQQVID
ncbi:MAG: YciI family protein [Acidobacteria bacterium]|nr:YciI family protein [Acidobacteriota bacterium]